jgi:hypothetical protein
MQQKKGSQMNDYPKPKQKTNLLYSSWQEFGVNHINTNDQK